MGFSLLGQERFGEESELVCFIAKRFIFSGFRLH
jgi:hypothetical protein